MHVLGLTGGMGTGKSTTARLFADEGIPVFDADETVHDLYQNEAVNAITQIVPQATLSGSVDREMLKNAIAQDDSLLKKIEAIIHPLVRMREEQFIKSTNKKRFFLCVLDIPLLFETGANHRVDSVCVCVCPPEMQRARIAARPGFDSNKADLLLSRQMPLGEKRARAHWVIDTSFGIDHARKQVRRHIQAVPR